MFLYKELSDKVLQAYFTMMRNLGVGYLESVYENAYCLELEALGVPFERQKLLEVHYKGHVIGTFKPDIVVDNKIIVEIKAIKELTPVCEAQLYNYLTVTGIEVGYLLNCGEARDYKRLIFKSAIPSSNPPIVPTPNK